jgi:hypothetical protein
MAGLFSKPKMPEVKPPAPMPDPENQNDAARRTMARETNRGGRRSTILSSGQRETLGA